ncbi:MAG: ABC transporter ATP-binding protein [Lachnospiraceae bacterium]|nr:ABC transporter ATP-binding protein [Lachnospiraceae bacterium]
MGKIFRKLNVLLDGRQKRQMAGIVVLMLIGGLLESLGVGLIVPVMSVLVTPDIVSSDGFISRIYTMLGCTSATQLGLYFLVALIVMFVVKNLFLYFVYATQLKFVYTNQFATSRRLMVGFMKRPYEYYLNANTSVIQRNITSDINNMYALILNLLQLTSEIIVFAGLTVICLLSDARMTVTIAAVLIVTLLLIKIAIKPAMTKAGTDNQDYYSALFQKISESVTGIKDIKIMAREHFFINSYADCGNGYVGAVQKYSLYSMAPRLLIEAVAIAAMAGYMIFVIARGATITQLMPQLTVLAAAAARLLPSANRINNYLTSIAFLEPIFMNVGDELQKDINDDTLEYSEDFYRRREDIKKLPVTECIEIRDLTYRYPNTEKDILKNASLTVPVGKSVGIVGASGAGKTTLIDVLLGLLKPQGGEILADGTDIFSDYRGWLKNVGYIPQMIFMLDGSIRDNVAFGVPKEEIDEEKLWAALKEAQLDTFVKGLPEGLDTQIGERGIRLSGGQRQRIGIARALYDDPEVMVLDEATSALDNETERAIMESINRLHGKKTLIIIAHRLQTIEKCDIVYRVEDGKALRGEAGTA